jgi:serine/threonine-protein kinase
MAESEIREIVRSTPIGADPKGPWRALAEAASAPFRFLRGQFGRSSEALNHLGAYRLEGKLGEGGMGVVYKAHHTLLDRPAAIKVLAPNRSRDEDLERFEREVRVTSRLTHPNTIAIYDFGRTRQGSYYYAMEYVEGLDLERLIEREGPQEPARVAHLLAQLAGALVEAHGAGLIHRDIKPANVMICERGGKKDVLKVLDFGLVKAMANDRAAESQDQRVVGTPLYLSPEALTAPERVDARSDLYAVGAVGYFLLTGAPPFTGANVVEVCLGHLFEAPEPPSERRNGIPRELEALILSCLAKSPDERPQSATTLQRALLELTAKAETLRAA